MKQLKKRIRKQLKNYLLKNWIKKIYEEIGMKPFQ